MHSIQLDGSPSKKPLNNRLDEHSFIRDQNSGLRGSLTHQDPITMLKAVAGYAGLLSVLLVLKSFITASPKLILATGVLSSFLFVFAFGFVTELGYRTGRKYQGWTDLILAYVLFAVGGVMIHPICLTVGTVASVAHLYYMNRVFEEQQAVTVTAKTK